LKGVDYLMDINKRFKTPAEAKNEARKLVNDIASMDNENMSLEDIFAKAKSTINSMLNSENIKLNTLLLIALKQKMALLDRIYKLCDKCLTELLSDKRLDHFHIESSDLLDKATKLLLAFSSILDSLTDKNETINFNFTNSITQNNIKGEIELPPETKEKMKLLALQYMQKKEENK